MATKRMRRADAKVAQAREVIKLKGTASVSLKDLPKRKINSQNSLQEVDVIRRCFLTCRNWEVLNVMTGKRMTIRKGQLVCLVATCDVNSFHTRSFTTMDGRFFTHTSGNDRDTCFLRPVFKESPVIWSDRV